MTEQLFTTAVIQIGDEIGEVDYLEVTPEELIAELTKDGYTGLSIRDGKVYFPPIPAPRYISQERWDAHWAEMDAAE